MPEFDFTTMPLGMGEYSFLEEWWLSVVGGFHDFLFLGNISISHVHLQPWWHLIGLVGCSILQLPEDLTDTIIFWYMHQQDLLVTVGDGNRSFQLQLTSQAEQGKLEHVPARSSAIFLFHSLVVLADVQSYSYQKI